MDEQIKQNLSELKEIMSESGIPEEAQDRQLIKLHDLILISIVKRISEKSEKNDENPTDENINEYIEKNYSKEELGSIIKEVSREKISAYLQAISKNTGQ